MNNIFSFEEWEAFEEWDCKLADEAGWEALVVIPTDELVEVETHELKDNAEMVPEVEGGEHSYHWIVMIPFSQVLQNLHLHQSLGMKSLLIPRNSENDKRRGN
jgi:hypothetical protein